jgi:hypothetical protein
MPRHGFWNKVEQVGSCLIWRGYMLQNGYGGFNPGPKYLAHRFAYESYYGSLPTWGKNGDLELDHLCRNRACVNPLHLELVSRRTNLLRSPIAPSSVNFHKTHCVHGHLYTPETTIIDGGWRRCGTCRAKKKES